MNPTITIQRQKISCHIGVPDEERSQPQELEVSTSFPVPNVDKAATADDIGVSIDYYSVYRIIHEVAEAHPRKLIETLAADIATRLIDEFKLEYIDLEIRKFILPDTEAVILNYRKTSSS